MFRPGSTTSAFSDDSSAHILRGPRNHPYGSRQFLRRKLLSLTGNCQTDQVLITGATSTVVPMHCSL